MGAARGAPPARSRPEAPRPQQGQPAKQDEPEATRKSEAAPATNGVAKVFVNRGERSGISEEDIRWALVEGAVVPEDSIGPIRVLERFSFVELDAEQAERALEMLDGTKLKGKQIRLEYARG